MMDTQITFPFLIDDNMQLEIQVFMRSDLIPGYDSALIGESADGRLIYSVDKILEVMTSTRPMSLEDAVEEFGFNIRGGNKNCIFVSEEGDVGSMIMENHEEMVEESHDQNIL